MMKVCRRPQAPGHRPRPLPWSAQRPASAERRRCQGGTPSTDQDRLDRRRRRGAKLQRNNMKTRSHSPPCSSRFESGTMARRRRNPPQSRQSVKVWLISHTPNEEEGVLFRLETPQTLPSPRRQATLGAVRTPRHASRCRRPYREAVQVQGQHVPVGRRTEAFGADYPSCVGRSRRRTLVGSLPSARIRPIACDMGSDTTAIWKALA